ncbi:MAG: Fic family protein [Planctomycetes bacterium]|nr:Fic family protein [Planctomycetota bacterium]
MTWNWQQPDWPHFSWQEDRLKQAEEQFLVGGGVILGAVSHLDGESREQLTVESMSEEAVTTSEIEGEVLNRDSVRSSVRRQLGLQAAAHRATPAEQGVAEMMVHLYRTSAKPLGEEMLCSWHNMLMQGRRDIREIGAYRTHEEPMRVVSGEIYDPTVHFEAPPSSRVPSEMTTFIEWFNNTSPTGSETLPALTRAGIAHLYFESIHPFEDGNGRIGRAISEKALAQALGGPTLTALATTILARRRSYYEMLEASNKRNAIGNWLAWFGGVALEAQQRTHAQVEFLIDKARLMDRLRDELNLRQEKVMLRVLAEGPEGFEGGLSAGNYQRIAKTSPATARRDLADLVEKGAFERTGERRHARYHLTIPLRPVSAVTIDEEGRVLIAKHRDRR